MASSDAASGTTKAAGKGGRKAVLLARIGAEQWEWLTDAATTHTLPDQAKAFRCCVNFVAQTDAAVAFQAAGRPWVELEERTVELAPSQMTWLTRMAEEDHVDGGAAAVCSSVIDHCMLQDPTAVFGVVRCKTATAARGSAGVAGLADETTQCEGARAALDAQANVKE
jgi:hypothetical protein